MARRRILLVIGGGSNYPLLIETATRLSADGQSVRIVFDGSDQAVLARLRARAREIGAEVVAFDDRRRREERSVRWKAASRVLSFKLRDKPERFKTFSLLHAASLRAAARIVRQFGPDLVVVSEDGITGNCWLIEAARRAGVPVLDTPYGFGTRVDLESDLAAKEARGALILAEGPDGAEVERRFPQWVKTGRFAGALMYPPDYILAREALGLGIRDAWMIHGGHADRLAVESDAMLAHYRREGVPAEKLAPVGTIYCDLLSEAVEQTPAVGEARRAAGKIRAGETSVLVSWPASYHADRTDRCEFASYEALADGVFGVLCRLDRARVTISLHPAAPREQAPRLRDMGFAVSDAHVVSLIPLHDIYVSCFSSTIRWAIAAAKPVVNYDFYGFALADYDAAPGVLTVTPLALFEQTISRLVSDDAHYHAIALAQGSVARDWGALDGRNFERIRALMETMIEESARREDRAPAVPR